MTLDTEKNFTRRSFLRIAGWGAFFTTAGISVIGTIRFLFPRVIFEQPPVFTIGFPDEFRLKEKPDRNGVCRVYENWKKSKSVWIIREQDRIYAVHSSCTHLGCTPNWSAEEGIFKCPCHGSRYSSNGRNFAGPAPRPLDRFRIFLNDNGQISVDKSKVYTYKEYNKTGAYLEI